MSLCPPSRGRRRKIPRSVKSTKGPKKGDENECPICHQSTDAKAPTLIHKTCGRWFDKERLPEWIKSQSSSTCPLCREELFDLWDLTQHDRFHEVVNTHHGLADPYDSPETYHVRRTQSQAVEIVHAAIPEMPQEKLMSSSAMRSNLPWTLLIIHSNTRTGMPTQSRLRRLSTTRTCSTASVFVIFGMRTESLATLNGSCFDWVHPRMSESDFQGLPVHISALSGMLNT